MVVANTAEAALQVIGQGNVAALITDYRLPGISGAGLIAELRQRGNLIPALVISAFNDDDDEVRGTSLKTKRTRILTWRIDDKHVIEVMRWLRDAANGPFLIHCQHGADRTGLMSAMYRVLEQGWKIEDALKELVDGGYGYHSMWRNIVKYLRSVDIEELRKAISR